MLSERYDARAAVAAAEVAEALYRAGAGLAPAPEIAEAYARHADLFSEEAVRAVVQAHAASAAPPQPASAAPGARREPSHEADASRNLAWFAVSGFFALALREVDERLAAATRRASVEWGDGQSAPYRLARAMALAEPHPRRRRDLDDAIAEVTASLNDLRQERLAALHGLARELGFADYTALCDSLRGLHLDTLQPLAEALAEATDADYRRLLTGWLGRLGLAPDEARPTDLAYLLRVPHYSALFPAAGLLRALTGTLDRLRLPLDDEPGLSLDAEPRPGKAADAFCTPVRVPSDVRLAYQPREGYAAYRALFGAAGEAEHAVHVAPGLPFGRRLVAGTEPLEASGLLFAEWLRSPRWVRDTLGVRLSEARDYLDLVNFGKLYRVRRLAARLRYELELHTGESGMDALYADVLTEATGIPHRPEDYLLDVSDGFAVAVSLRAAIFEVQLRRWLENTAGENWFHRPEGSQPLTRYWSAGAQPLEALLPLLGAAALDPDPLIEDLLEPRD